MIDVVLLAFIQCPGGLDATYDGIDPQAGQPAAA